MLSDDIAGYDSTLGFTQQANRPVSIDADVRFLTTVTESSHNVVNM